VPTETSWSDQTDHGYVAVFDEKGALLKRVDGFQHNMMLRNGGAYDARAIGALVEAVQDALASQAGRAPGDEKAVVESQGERLGAPGAPAA